MTTIARLALALTLGITAASALIAPPSPAYACGGYEASPESEVRDATFVFLYNKRPEVQSPRIESLDIDGETASVEIRFRTERSRTEKAQFLFLTRNDDEVWTVTGQSRTIPVALASLFTR